MKTILATAIVALALASTGASAASGTKFDAAKFFEQIQLNGH